MYLVLDIGGTKMRLARSADGKTLGEVQIFSTPDSPEEAVNILRQAVGQESFEAVGVGITRRRRDIAVLLPALFTCPVHIENDAALAALGEAVVGAGVGTKIVAFLTVSTGVGGARVVSGRLEASAFGFEPGRQLVSVGDESKSLEDLISGRAMEAKFGRPPREITEPAVWQEVARYLALGLHNTLVHWSPEVVVLGGQMILGTPAIDLGEVERQLEPLLSFYQFRPVLKKAALGDLAGLNGALIHCLSQDASLN